jgi:hypothetical protein
LQGRGGKGAAGAAEKERAIAPFAPIRPRHLVPLLAVSTVCSLAAPAAAPAQTPSEPPSACRNTVCATTLQVGAKPVRWSAPEVFYPNNEDVFAGVVSRTKAIAEVRRFGPGLCRHGFKGAGVSVVIKACGPQAMLRVRAVRVKRGVRALSLSYVARPVLDSYSEAQPTSATMFERLTQITGLAG